ncbi:hypothetical protein BB560_000641, partial [Smittium megazygosporum]
MEVDSDIKEYLSSLESQLPNDLAKLVSDCAVFFERRFWHQLTETAFEFLTDPRSEQFRLSFYLNFISYWGKNMNKTKLVIFAVLAANQLQDKNEVDDLFSKVLQIVNTPESQDAYAFALLENGNFKLLQNDLDSTMETMKQAKQIISSLNKVDPVIHASYYRLNADYYKVKANFGDYYRNSLLYLSCIKIEDLSQAQQFERAHDLAVSALLSDSIYNFGDLLSHPIIQTLKDSEQFWLYELLLSFNNGDISSLMNLRDRLQNHPLLLQKVDFLQKKMRLMALVEIVFKKQGSGDKNDQSIPFEVLASDIKVAVSDIEHLVMMALSLRLIDGKIDEISKCVNFKWVQPRYLDKSQIKTMAVRLDYLNLRSLAMINEMN